MKRKPKKLTLSRETLIVLDESHLSDVAGGATLGCTHTGQSNCCSGTLCSLCC
ncbi:MAG TPA: class I lanthipeptide [Thermoanaerobaculia bacterium]|nr:class I lanthipeptide [Thermoanaerobaculia bacterium]